MSVQQKKNRIKYIINVAWGVYYFDTWCDVFEIVWKYVQIGHNKI